MGTGSFPGGKRGRGVTLTPRSLLVPWSRKSRVISLNPLWAVQPVQSLSACTRVHLLLSGYYKRISHIFKFLSKSGATVRPKNLVSHIFPRHILTYASWRISSLVPLEAKAFDLSIRVFRPVRSTAQKRPIALFCLSVRTEYLDFHWTNFLDISYLEASRKYLEKTQAWIKSDTKGGTVHEALFILKTNFCRFADRASQYNYLGN